MELDKMRPLLPAAWGKRTASPAPPFLRPSDRTLSQKALVSIYQSNFAGMRRPPLEHEPTTFLILGEEALSGIHTKSLTLAHRMQELSLVPKLDRIIVLGTKQMIDPDELHKTIAERRAEQAARERTSPPDHVRLGPLVSAAMDGARWRGQNAFPSSQEWSDEVERVFAFAVAHGQFGNYLPRLRGRWNQFDSALAELRVAFYLDRNQFRVAGWEPAGARGVKGEGEFLATGPSGISTFVEVKSPGWEGELSKEEIEAGRTNQPKHLYCEARAVGPWERVQFEVEKAYKKFKRDTPNLLVIADDLFVSLEYGTDLQMGMALYEKRTNGCFADSKFENLGAVGAFWVVKKNREIWCEMKLYANAHALKSTAIPEDMRLAFGKRTIDAASDQESSAFHDLSETPLQQYLRNV